MSKRKAEIAYALLRRPVSWFCSIGCDVTSDHLPRISFPSFARPVTPYNKATTPALKRPERRVRPKRPDNLGTRRGTSTIDLGSPICSPARYQTLDRMGDRAMRDPSLIIGGKDRAHAVL